MRSSVYPRWLQFLGLIVMMRALALDGALDPSFHAPSLAPIPNLIVVQADGKSLISVGSAGGTAGVVRLNTNGAMDPGFSTGSGPLIITPPIDIPSAGIHIPGATNPGSIAAVALQSGGRVIVGGNFTHFANTTPPRNVLVRLKPDGSVDATFTAGNSLSGGQGGTSIQAIAVDETDRIYVGGKFTKVSGANRATSLVRLKPDGSLDSTFIDITLAGLGSASIQDISLQPDHKVLVTSTYFTAALQGINAVHRLLPNGGLDPDFQQAPGPNLGTSASGLRHALLPNGQILATFLPTATSTYNGVAITGSIFRLNSNGSVDSSYPNPVIKYFNTKLAALHMVPVSDGRVYVSGGFNSIGDSNQSGLARLLSNGAVDPTFVPAVSALVGGFAIAVQPDSKVLVQNSALDGANLTYGVVRLLVGGVTVDPPKITVQPVGLTVATGATAVFSVTATGTGLTYRWRRGNVDVSGGTSPTLDIHPATSADAGAYTVVVSNPGGSVTSVPVQLTVLDPPHITVPPLPRTVKAGNETIFSVVATGAPNLKYQWFKDNQVIVGATSESYRIVSPSAKDAGKYSIKVTNAVGSEMSLPVDLVIQEPPTISPQPASQSVLIPPTLAGPCDGLTTANLPGHTLSVKIISGRAPFATSGNYQIILAPAGGTYAIPASGAIPASTGSWSLGPDLGVKTVLTLGHYFANGLAAKVALLPDCTCELYADGLSASQGGTFAVSPTILRPPVSVTFVSGATGTGPFTYQWRHNGMVISGANDPQLLLPDVRPSDLGQYTVVVTGPAGSVESQPATLTEAALVAQPTLTFQVMGGTTLHFAIPPGFRLERSASLAEPVWSNVPGSGSVDVPSVGAAAYFRLVQP